MKEKVSHKCTLNLTTTCFLPPLDKDASSWQKWKRFLREITLCYRNHLKRYEYFPSNSTYLEEVRRHLHQNFPYTIHPFSLFRMVWETVMFLVFGGQMITYPIYIAFEDRDIVNNIIILVNFGDFICFFDMFVIFFSGYTIEEIKQTVLEPKKIAEKYLHGFFIIDILTLMPVKYLLRYVFAMVCDKYYILDMIFICKLFRMITVFEYLRNMCNLVKVEENIYLWMKFLFLSLSGVHWIACLNYFVANIMADIRGYYHPKSWISSANLQEDSVSWKAIYLFCLFRTTCFITGLSYAIYEPETYEDLILESILFFLGRTLYTWIFVVLMQILITSTVNNWKYQEIENQLQEYMRFKQLPMNMQKRLLSYYNYRYGGTYFSESAITALFTERLKQEINMCVYKRVLEKVYIFRDLPEDVLNDIIKNLKTEVFLPGDILVNAGSVGECMYFLACGTVAVLTSTGKEVCHLQDGAYFGEIALLMKDKKRTATVKAIEICQVYKLDRKNFQYCLATNRTLYSDLQRAAYERIKKIFTMEKKKSIDKRSTLFDHL